MCSVEPSSLAVLTSAVVQSKSATAGNSMGAKCRLAPSRRTEPVVTITSPTFRCGWMAPVVPMRRKVRIPSWASSSTAMEVDGPPIPVEQMITALPSISPRQVVNSRWLARCTGLSNSSAMRLTRSGSPGTIARVAPCRSAFFKPKWKTSDIVDSWLRPTSGWQSAVKMIL
ncbi:hypothetical protein D3C85_998390 [compost metagenome]